MNITVWGLALGQALSFIGATTLLTSLYRPEDKARVQGLNDLLVFGSAAVAALLAGYWQQLFGWQVLNLLMMPVIVIAMISVWWSSRKQLTMNPVHK